MKDKELSFITYSLKGYYICRTKMIRVKYWERYKLIKYHI